MIYFNTTKKLESIDFLFKNYLSFPKAERTFFYLSLLNETFTFKNLEMGYSDIIIGYNYRTLKNYKNESNKFLITKNTKVNYYYKSYRILILIDMSRSMFNYDIFSNKLIIEKIEDNLKNIFENFKNFSKKFRNFKQEEYVDFFPVIYLSISYSINENDFPVIFHEIFFEKETYEYYLKKIMKKIKNYISNSLNNEISKIKNINYQNDNYLNKILQHSLFLLDLLPREATPILFILTDSNLNLNNLGKYNNILHQFNRKDIKINIINLYNMNSNFLTPFNINNQQIMQYICEFTDGKYFNYYEKLNDNNYNNFTLYHDNIINLNINKNENNSLITFNKRNNFECIDENIDLFNKPPKIFYSKKIKNYKKLNIDDNLLNNLNNSKNYKNIFYSFDSLKLLKNIEFYHQELFDEYEISLSYDNISIARIREGFKVTKNKYKFKLMLFPDAEIKYIIENKDKNSTNFNIKIFIISKFIKLNQLKLEYKKNSYNIEKEKNNYNPSYFVTVIINFITEVVCNDKILTWYCENIKEDFQENKHKFIESKKDLWNYLGNLNIDNWYRFFNVEIIEVLIKNENYEDMIKNKLNNDKKNENELKEEKNIIEEFIYKFCDKKITEINFGFKLIPKKFYSNEVQSENGFLVIKFFYKFDNLLLIYFGFFQCLSVTRKTNIKKFCEHLNSNQKNKLLINYYRHLSLIYNNFNNYNENEIFTYQPNQKFMNNFFHKKDRDKQKEKKNFKPYELNNKYFSFLFYKFLILQRLKENFSIMDLKDNKIILVYKFDMINLKNPMKIKLKNWFKNYFYIIYVITLNDNKILIEINIEPFSGFIILKKIEDKKEKYKKLEGYYFLLSIINYFRNSENKIYDWIKTYGYLINIIYKKLSDKNLFKLYDNNINFYSLFFDENKYKFDDSNYNHLKNFKVELQLLIKSEQDKFKNNLNLITTKEFTINNFQSNILYETLKRILISIKECFDNLLKDIQFKINNQIFYGNLFNINTFVFISIPQINFIDNEDDINLNNKFNINFYYLSLDYLKVGMKPLIEMLLKKYSKKINEIEEDEKNLSDNESNNSFKNKKKRSERSLSINENDNIENYYIKNCLKKNILLHPLKEENNNFDEIIHKSDLFDVLFSDFINDYFDYTSLVIDNIIHYNKMLSYIIYFPEEINNNLKNFYSFEINFDIMKLISIENEYEFFFSKFKIICNENFFVVKDNLYVNKQIKKYEINNYNLITEINYCVENDFIPFVLDFEKLFNSINNNKKFILKMKIFFLPFYQNIYKKNNINKIIKENNFYSIIKDNFEIYYKNNEINDFKKQIPFFFKKNNFYFFIKEIEEYLLNLYNNFLYIKYIFELEKIRNQINSNNLNNQELINEGLFKMNMINNINIIFNEEKGIEIKNSKNLNKYLQNNFIFNNNYYSINFFESEKTKENYQKLFKTKENLPFWCLFNFEMINNSTIKIKLKWIKIFEKNDIKSKLYLEYTKNIFKIIESKIFFINKNIIIDIIKEKREYLIDNNIKDSNKVKFKEDLNKYFGIDKSLISYEGKYNENNIIKILNKYFENFAIKNSDNYFILEDNQQVFIFSFKINNFHHSNTFHFNSMKNINDINKDNKIEKFKKTFIINKISLDENKPNYILNHNEKFLIDFSLFGLTLPNENILNLLQNSFKNVLNIEKLNIYIKLLENKREIKKLSQYKIFDINEYKNNTFEKKKENIKYLDETINYFYELTNKVFDKLINNNNYNQDFSCLDFEIIKTFSEVYNIENNFKILKNYKFLKKNLIYNLINFYQYFKDNKIKFIKYNNGTIKIVLTFNQQTNYFLFLTYESFNDDDMNKEYEISYEIIKRKLNEDDNKINIENNINSKELNYFINEFIEDLIYVYNIENIYKKYKK